MAKKGKPEEFKENKYTPPQANSGDTLHALARAGISSIPIVGGAGTELFSLIVVPPLERRRDSWMNEITDALLAFEEAGFITLDDLKDNDVFIDTLLSASQIALKSSQEEKRLALRNVILNSTKPEPPDESKQHFFLNIIDEITVWHIRILWLFNDPVHWFRENGIQWPNISMGSLSAILETAYPELKGQRAFYDQIWKDINSYGLTNTESLHGMMSGNGLREKRTSELGKEFLALIDDPLA